MPALAAFLFATFPVSAPACTVEGTTSTVLQVLVGVLVGGLFAANHYKSQIGSVWKRISRRSGDDDRIGT